MDGLTDQEIAAFASDFDKDKKNQVLSRAAQRSGLLAASFNSKVSSHLNRVFSKVSQSILSRGNIPVYKKKKQTMLCFQ